MNTAETQRRQPKGTAMRIEYLVWGRKASQEAWEESLLKTGCATMADAMTWKEYAERDGFLHVRISRFDPAEKPNFIGTITG